MALSAFGFKCHKNITITWYKKPPVDRLLHSRVDACRTKSVLNVSFIIILMTLLRYLHSMWRPCTSFHEMVDTQNRARASERAKKTNSTSEIRWNLSTFCVDKFLYYKIFYFREWDENEKKMLISWRFNKLISSKRFKTLANYKEAIFVISFSVYVCLFRNEI